MELRKINYTSHNKNYWNPSHNFLHPESPGNVLVLSEERWKNRFWITSRNLQLRTSTSNVIQVTTITSCRTKMTIHRWTSDKNGWAAPLRSPFHRQFTILILGKRTIYSFDRIFSLRRYTRFDKIHQDRSFHFFRQRYHRNLLVDFPVLYHSIPISFRFTNTTKRLVLK